MDRSLRNASLEAAIVAEIGIMKGFGQMKICEKRALNRKSSNCKFSVDSAEIRRTSRGMLQRFKKYTVLIVYM